MTHGYKRKLAYLDNPKLSLEIFDSMIGDFINSGCSREVFEYVHDKNYVIKIESESGKGDNFLEWDIWNSVKYTENAKWFAPCFWISPNGMLLIQRKTKDFYFKSKAPDRIPSFFTDIKPSNFGWIGNQLVAHDYAFSSCMVMSEAATKNKTQSVKGKW